MRTKQQNKGKKSIKKPVKSPSRLLNENLTLENFEMNRILVESSLKNVFAKFENDNDKDKFVVFY